VGSERKLKVANYESGGQEFESLRARHSGTNLGTPKPTVFALGAATSARNPAHDPGVYRRQFRLRNGAAVGGLNVVETEPVTDHGFRT
jgi:hypothetical protein